jgi:hypothetical protein
MALDTQAPARLRRRASLQLIANQGARRLNEFGAERSPEVTPDLTAARDRHPGMANPSSAIRRGRIRGRGSNRFLRACQDVHRGRDRQRAPMPSIVADRRSAARIALGSRPGDCRGLPRLVGDGAEHALGTVKKRLTAQPPPAKQTTMKPSSVTFGKASNGRRRRSAPHSNRVARWKEIL